MQMRRCWYGNQSLQGRNRLCAVCVWVYLRGWQLAVRKVRANQALTLMHTALWPLQHLSFFLMCSLSLLHAVSLPLTVILTLSTHSLYRTLFFCFLFYISLIFCRDASWQGTKKKLAHTAITFTHPVRTGWKLHYIMTSTDNVVYSDFCTDTLVICLKAVWTLKFTDVPFTPNLLLTGCWCLV